MRNSNGMRQRDCCGKHARHRSKIRGEWLRGVLFRHYTDAARLLSTIRGRGLPVFHKHRDVSVTAAYGVGHLLHCKRIGSGTRSYPQHVYSSVNGSLYVSRHSYLSSHLHAGFTLHSREPVSGPLRRHLQSHPAWCGASRYRHGNTSHRRQQDCGLCQAPATQSRRCMGRQLSQEHCSCLLHQKR